MSRHRRKNAPSKTKSKNTAKFSSEKSTAKNCEPNDAKLGKDNAEDAPLSPSRNAFFTPSGAEHDSSNAISKNPEKTKRILIWILLGALASFLPLVFSIIRDLACGFNTLRVNYFRDLALVLAAVAANALSYALGSLQKYWSCALSGLSLSVGFTLYYLFRPNEQLNNTLLNGMIFTCAVLLAMNTIIGFLIAREEPKSS